MVVLFTKKNTFSIDINIRIMNQDQKLIFHNKIFNDKKVSNEYISYE